MTGAPTQVTCILLKIFLATDRISLISAAHEKRRGSNPFEFAAPSDSNLESAPGAERARHYTLTMKFPSTLSGQKMLPARQAKGAL